MDYVRQLAFPIGVVVPLGQRFSVDIGTYYATTFVGLGGSHESFQDLTDTQVRGTYVFGNDAVVASVMLNLPTGPETTSLQSFGVAASSASNFLLFPVNTYGSGFSLTPGLAGAITAGSWNLGLAASVRWSAEYQPFSGSANSNVRYQPGVETRIRAGVDRLVGQGRLAVGATFSTFANDQLTGSGGGGGTFDPGNRILVDGEFSTRAGAGTIALYAWNYHRSGSGQRHQRQGERVHRRRVGELGAGGQCPAGTAGGGPVLVPQGWQRQAGGCRQRPPLPGLAPIGPRAERQGGLRQCRDTDVKRDEVRTGLGAMHAPQGRALAAETGAPRHGLCRVPLIGVA